MATISGVAEHYAQNDLVDAIRHGLQTTGKRTDALTIDDLAPVDEFHIGGRQASEHLFQNLELSQGMHVLDIGCGLGGAARLAASRYGCNVSGIDVTPEFIKTGQTLCDWLGLSRQVTLQHADALAMPFPDATFDRAYMLHVGMNVPDKSALCREVARVLRPGALFGVYDIMRTGAGELTYPLPWATTAETSWVAEPSEYRRALESAGFEPVSESVQTELAQAFFERLRANAAAAAGPPPLGLHLVMGKTTREKVRNMIDNVTAGSAAPVETIARKR